ncbi:MAG: hypothetical protein JRI25_08450 [Deltaproteobacteria bacterium]|nr:hypothetical protein [Deltaproteobacteria bacterium]
MWFDIIAALGLTLSTAHAADPVLYTGDAETALARIALTTETPSDYLRPVSVESVLAAGPAFAHGEATVVPCEGRPLDAAGLRAEAERLYAAILMGLAPQRADVARRAPMRLACLDSYPNAAQAARLLSLAGVVDQLAGDEGAAEQAHLAARAFDPEVTWNPEWAPEARIPFDRALVVALVEDPVPLEWRPSDAAVWVDGRQVYPGEVEVVPGLHLLQWGDPIRTIVVDVTGETMVVLPSEFEAEPLLDGPGEDLGPILDHTLGELPGAYVVANYGLYAGYARKRKGKRTWTWTPVDRLTSELPQQEPEPVFVDPRQRRRTRARLVAVGVGAGTLLAVPVAVALNGYLADRHEARGGESDGARRAPTLAIGGRF